MKVLLPTKIPNPNDYSGFLLWQKANKWENYVNGVLKKYNLVQSEQLFLISLLWLTNQQKEVTQANLAEFSGAKPMHVSKVLKKFEKQGLITKKPGSDPRSKIIFLTDSAYSLLISTATDLAKADNEFFNQENKQEFIKYLKKL